MLREPEGPKISEAIAEGLRAQLEGPRCRSSKPRLDKLAAMIPDVEEGDEIVMSWIPDKGTKVTVRGTDRGMIEGRDFADALFAVWLGPEPGPGGPEDGATGRVAGSASGRLLPGQPPHEPVDPDADEHQPRPDPHRGRDCARRLPPASS